MTRVVRIRRRDGAVAAFERRLVEGAVQRAAERAGEDDSRAPTEVADLVEMALARRYGPDRARAAENVEPNASLPGVEEIEDLIEEALIELGHATVAKAYILERARDSRVRAALGAQGEDAPLGRRAPRVLVNGGLEPWSRPRIVAALLAEADVPRGLAEEVAARVEERVFASGWKRVSTALVRELVDNELVERGLADVLRRTRPVGVPRHDLSRWLASGEPEFEPGSAEPRALEARVAGELLRRYALEDVLPDALADALADGDFGLEDLDRLHLDLALAVPCELLVTGEFDAAKAFDLLPEVAGLAARTSRGVVLEDCAELLAVLVRAQRGGGGGGGGDRLAAWIAALAAVARASGRSVSLNARLKSRERGPASPGWFERLVEDLAAAEADGPRPGLARVFVDAAELVDAAGSSPALERGVELLLARGRIVPTFGSASERAVGPGLARGARERGALALRAALTLNLPRAARRAGPWREDALFEELLRVLGLGLDALAAVRDLRRGPSASGPRARAAHAIVPVGLREAASWIGDGTVRPETTARLVAFLAEAAQRLAQERGLAVTLCGAYGERDARRFASLDARRFHVAQPDFFQAPDARRADAAYTHGFDLAGAGDATLSRAEESAVVLSALSSGVLDGPNWIRAIARPQDGRAPLLAGLDAFERHFARQRARTTTLHALPRATEAASLYSDDAPATH